MHGHQLCSLSFMDLSMRLKGQKAMQYFPTGSANFCSMVSCSYFYRYYVVSCRLQASVTGKITFPCGLEIHCLPVIEVIVWSEVFNVYDNIRFFLVSSKVSFLSGFQSSSSIGNWLGLGAYPRM